MTESSATLNCPGRLVLATITHISSGDERLSGLKGIICGSLYTQGSDYPGGLPEVDYLVFKIR